MDTPQNNPDGYAVSKVLNYVDGYPTQYAADKSSASALEPVMLKLTHGTGDDNVHHQNTLQLLDAMHIAGKKFDFMIYPDGMHGYYGYQGDHFQNANNEFWLKYLCR
jgi:dipeptidyl-peptidase-4